MKIDYSDLDGDPGVVLEYHDAPEDERINPDDAAHALTRLTEQMINILGASGAPIVLCEEGAHQITKTWHNILKIAVAGW